METFRDLAGKECVINYQGLQNVLGRVTLSRYGNGHSLTHHFEFLSEFSYEDGNIFMKREIGEGSVCEDSDIKFVCEEFSAVGVFK